MLETHRVHFFCLPAFRIERPRYVVPQHVELPVIRHEFPDQPVRVGHKSLSRRRISGAESTVRVMPVHERIIEPSAQSLLAPVFSRPPGLAAIDRKSTRLN